MPRDKRVGGRDGLDSHARAPLAPHGGFGSAIESLIVWASSATLRADVMRTIDFPLPHDVPAFLLVNQLVYRGASRPVAIAEAMQTTTSNITKVVQRLERAGLVHRAPDPVDRRGVEVALTEVGREAGHRLLAYFARLFDAAYAGWSPEDRRAYEAASVRFARALVAAAEETLPAHDT